MHSYSLFMLVASTCALPLAAMSIMAMTMSMPVAASIAAAVLLTMTAAQASADASKAHGEGCTDCACGERQAPPALNFTMKSIRGEDISLAEKYAGKVVLIVNVASKCGHTRQYADLQALHEKYSPRGLAVLGFPCNQFGGQEPGSEQEIAAFCKKNYGVSFDLFEKIEVNGDNAAPLYAYLTSDKTGLEDTGPVKWNFEKFLIDREGKVVARFRSKVKPASDEVVTAIENALGSDDGAVDRSASARE